MLSRIAARLVTGPLAFLIGGMIELLAFVLASHRARRLTERRPKRGS